MRRDLVPVRRRADTSSRTASRIAASIDGNSRSMNPMKCVRVPSCRYITLQPTKRAPWSAMALIVRSSFERDDEKPGTMGAISTPAWTPASDERTHRAQPLQRMRCPGLERAPGIFVYGRHAHVDRARFGRARVFEQDVDVAHDHRPLCDEAHRRPCARQCLDGAACQPVVSFDRLIWVGRRAERDLLARPRRPIELALQHVDEVPLDENDRRELVVGVHLELGVIAAGEAVVAGVRAAAVRVERPVERHPLDRVQGRSTVHFLVGRFIGPSLGLGQRGGPALPDELSDPACGGTGRGTVKQEGFVQDSLFVRQSSSSPRLCESSPTGSRGGAARAGRSTSFMASARICPQGRPDPCRPPTASGRVCWRSRARVRCTRYGRGTARCTTTYFTFRSRRRVSDAVSGNKRSTGSARR